MIDSLDQKPNDLESNLCFPEPHGGECGGQADSSLSVWVKPTVLKSFPILFIKGPNCLGKILYVIRTLNGKEKLMDINYKNKNFSMHVNLSWLIWSLAYLSLWIIL